MRILQILAPVLAASLMSACASMKDANTEGDMSGKAADGSQLNTATFSCDNGFRVQVARKADDEIVLNFNAGKGAFHVPAKMASAASGEYFVNEAKTVEWHQKGDSAVFTYPDGDYSSNGQLEKTVCRRN